MNAGIVYPAFMQPLCLDSHVFWKQTSYLATTQSRFLRMRRDGMYIISSLAVVDWKKSKEGRERERENL